MCMQILIDSRKWKFYFALYVCRYRGFYFNLQFFIQMENYYSRQGTGGRYASYQSSSARSRSPENHPLRRRSRSRSPVHISSSTIKKKQRHLQYQQYYEEKKALDKIKTNREEEEYTDYYTPSTSRNLPGGPKKVSTEKMSKREKSLRKDAQSLCEKELAEWDEQENELDAFLAGRGGSDSDSEEEDTSIASKLPPLDSVVKNEPRHNRFDGSDDDSYIPYHRKKPGTKTQLDDRKPYLPYGKPSKKEANTESGFPSLPMNNNGKNYEPYGKRSAKSSNDVSQDPPIRPSSSTEVRKYQPYGKRNKTSKEYEPYKKKKVDDGYPSSDSRPPSSMSSSGASSSSQSSDNLSPALKKLQQTWNKVKSGSTFNSS